MRAAEAVWPFPSLFPSLWSDRDGWPDWMREPAANDDAARAAETPRAPVVEWIGWRATERA